MVTIGTQIIFATAIVALRRLTLIFFPLHRAQASCERRSRLGSDSALVSAESAFFFRLRLGPAVGG